MNTKTEPFDRKSIFVNPRLISNGVKKLLGFLKERARGILYAGTFVSLADYTQSYKLSSLYNSNQDLPTYLNTIFKIAISAGAILAVLRLGYAGYIYMGTDLWGNKEKAKEMIGEFFLGFFLLLGVYVILYQINPNILNLKIALTPIPAVAAPGVSVAGPGVSDLDRLDGNTARGMLAAAGGKVNHPMCQRVGDTNCTNVGGLSFQAIQKIVALASRCGCGVIMITGGTEYWLHSANTLHRPGGSSVDFSKAYNPDFNRFITNNSLPPIASPNGNRYDMSGVGTFLDETIDGNAPHWHVTF